MLYKVVILIAVIMFFFEFLVFACQCQTEWRPFVVLLSDNLCFLKLGILFWICLFPLHTFCFGSYYKYKFFGSYVSSFLFPPTSPIARSSSWNNDTHMALDGYKINLNFPPQVNLSRATKSSILPWAPPWRPCQHWCAIASHWSTSVCSLSSLHYLVTSPSLPTPPPSQPYQHSSRETLRTKVFPQQSGGLQKGSHSFVPQSRPLWAILSGGNRCVSIFCHVIFQN